MHQSLIRFRELVFLGLGMLAGIAVMTTVGLMAEAHRVRTFDPTPRILTVGELAEFCHACQGEEACGLAENGFDNGFCTGVLLGVLDSRSEVARLCVPRNWSMGQATALFLAWAADHPGERDKPAADGVLRAYAARFDCLMSKGGI